MISHESSDAELIRYCLSGPRDRIIGGIPEGNLVVRISEQTVIKFGPGLSKDEAINQQRAYDLLDHDIVRVPRVHRFFTDNMGRGYIMMDYMEGRVIDPLEPDRIKRLARVLDYFSMIEGDTPGSLSGGPCRGLLWPETQDLTFWSMEKMEAWFNSRLFPGEGKVSFRNCNLVLCHLDIAPRNVIWQSDGGICLVDWASAGFYPRLFEFWAQWNIEGKDGSFNRLLLDSMKPLQDHEMAQKWSICRVWYNIQKYAL
ncbi:kinase-like domain-containing protein [Paecilomyces variotii]|uniref:Kinase-like domain-containing protein n=1 Tax=Byssochlamys spectabilis TaxID=264951 RepID=A0A443HP44_BYSSP|nr:kinase-like domain-containing protein [Paecilomyces variotii]RWQ93559.1 kinase-like domain-containing protein [Paecilomyces variotii]